jgi:hypothetical protein
LIERPAPTPRRQAADARRLARYVWASPCTAIGLVAASALWALGAQCRVRSGVVEVNFTAPLPGHASVLLKSTFAALTLGHVVLARSQADQDTLRQHERAHVAQYERWGPVFLLAYALSSLIQFLAGRRPYLDNHFEVQARNACRAPPQRSN